METGWPRVPAGGGAASDVAAESQWAAVYVAGRYAAADVPNEIPSALGCHGGPGELAGQMPIGGSKGGTGGLDLASYRNRVRHEAAAFRPAQPVPPSPPPAPPRSGPTPRSPPLQYHSPGPHPIASRSGAVPTQCSRPTPRL